MSRFILHLKDLEEGTSTHHFTLPHQWVAEELEGVEGIDAGAKEGSADLEVTRRGRRVLLHGTVRASLRLVCVRCLEEFDYPTEAAVDVLMLPDAGSSSQDDLGVEHYRGEEIELDGLLRDLLILEVPMNPSCGTDCAGWDHLLPKGQDRSE